MSYHRFANLHQLFRSDLVAKLTDGLLSCDFMKLECNCQGSNLRDGVCLYGGNCHASCLIYKATCRLCSCFYIWSTHQKLKKRMTDHLNQTQALANGQSSLQDTFADHFAEHLKVCQAGVPQITSQHAKHLINVDVLWSDNPLLLSKTFWRQNCKLCMEERIQILKCQKKHPGKCLNSNYELMLGCRHYPRFHRFQWSA